MRYLAPHVEQCFAAVLPCLSQSQPLTLHSVTMKAIYDSMRSRSPLPAESDALPESVLEILHLRSRLQALLMPYPVGRRMRLHGMATTALNGALVEVAAAGVGGDGRVTVKIIEGNAVVVQKYSNGMRVKCDNLEMVGLD